MTASVRSLRDSDFPPLAPRARLRWHVVAPLYDSLPHDRVLEVGCGQGGFGARFAATSTYLGVEPDPTSAAVATRRVEPHGGRVVTADYASLAGQHFDLVCAFEVVEHLEDDHQVVRDLAELVEPGGHLVLSAPAVQARFAPMDVRAGHFRRYDPGQLSSLCSAAGLVDVRETLYGWPLAYALERVRNPIDARHLARAAAAPESAASLTAASGRLRQPSRVATGQVTRWAAAPFGALQRLRPARGTGVVVSARRPR